MNPTPGRHRREPSSADIHTDTLGSLVGPFYRPKHHRANT